MQKTFQEEAIFELGFWMPILHDHSQFILEALANKEESEILKAKEFKNLFNNLAEKAGQPLTESNLMDVLNEAHHTSQNLRVFKLNLLKKMLTTQIGIGLTPSFLNHMVNELDEGLRVFSFLTKKQHVQGVHPLHHDLLWLLDAAGHAGAINGKLDRVEKKLKKKSEQFTKEWEDFYLKAIEMAGFLRTKLYEFPALSHFHSQVELEMTIFKNFLDELEELQLSKETLDAISPLMADHMAREECYYLIKLAETTNEVKMPDCSPLQNKPPK